MIYNFNIWHCNFNKKYISVQWSKEMPSVSTQNLKCIVSVAFRKL